MEIIIQHAAGIIAPILLAQILSFPEQVRETWAQNHARIREIGLADALKSYGVFWLEHNIHLDALVMLRQWEDELLKTTVYEVSRFHAQGETTTCTTELLPAIGYARQYAHLANAQRWNMIDPIGQHPKVSFLLICPIPSILIN